MFLRGTLQAQSAEEWCSQTGTLQTQMSNEATDGLAPSVLDSSLGAAKAASYEFPPVSEEEPRRETPSWTRILLPMPGAPVEDWCSEKGTLQTHKCPTRLPTGWHCRFLPFFGRS